MSISDGYLRLASFESVRKLCDDTTTKRQRATLALSTPWTVASTPSENALVCLWTTVLALDEVGLDDTFFDLGGDSLQAVQLIVEIRQQFGVEVSIEAFFEAATIRHLARVLANLNHTGVDDHPSNGDILIATERSGHALSIIPYRRRFYFAALERAEAIGLRWASMRGVRVWRLTGGEMWQVGRPSGDDRPGK